VGTLSEEDSLARFDGDFSFSSKSARAKIIVDAKLQNRFSMRILGHTPRALIAAAAWVYLASIAYATLSIAPEPSTHGFLDELLTLLIRFGAHAVLGVLFCLAYPRHLSFVCILVFGSAVVLELLRDYIPNSDARYLDFVEKLFGGATGILWGIFTQDRVDRRSDAATGR
jgi:hypothetical protein